MELTDTQLTDLARSERPWNIARRTFATYAARLSAILEDCADDLTIEDIRSSSRKIRRLEFEAVAQIGKALGVLVSDAGGATPGANPDPEGLRKWLGAPGTCASGAPLGTSGEAPRPGSTGPGRELPLGPENVGERPSGEAPNPSE